MKTSDRQRYGKLELVTPPTWQWKGNMKIAMKEDN